MSGHRARRRGARLPIPHIRPGLHLRPGLHIRPRQQIRSAAAIAAAATAGTGAIIAIVVFSTRSGDPPIGHLRSASASDSPAVGALFSRTPDGKLGTHFCTASVVDSTGGDLVLTAAHCLAGVSAQDIAFVPGFTDGRSPYGVWMVTRIVEDQHWRSSGDPDDDFAFLVVREPGSSAEVQSLTGGEAIGINGKPGGLVTVAGYPDDANSQLSCRGTVLAFSQTQLEFDCAGYSDGTSGGPFLVPGADGAGTVIGVIGGYQQGGDSPAVSYAARFGASMAALYRTAEAESAGAG